MTKSLSWLYETLNDYERGAIGDLFRMVSVDTELARLVAGFRWYKTDVTWEDRLALEHMARIAAIDLELARLVAETPWLADDLTPNEAFAVLHLWQIAYKVTSNSRNYSRAYPGSAKVGTATYTNMHWQHLRILR